jgi:hypothetical protein
LQLLGAKVVESSAAFRKDEDADEQVAGLSKESDSETVKMAVDSIYMMR